MLPYVTCFFTTRKLGAHVNQRTADGSTALLVAAYEGQLDVVRLLIEKGADVNAMNENGFTPAMVAAYVGYDEIVSILRQHGALLENASRKDEL